MELDLTQLAGTSLGPGEWMAVERQDVLSYQEAIGSDVEVGPLFVVSLLPALTRQLVLPLPEPRAVINYGLDLLESGVKVEAGDRLRARIKLADLEWVGGKTQLQVKRLVEVENQKGETVLSATTIARFVFSG